MAAETGRRGGPLDAARPGERKYPRVVELNFDDLLGGNFAFGARHPDTVADLGTFNPEITADIPVQVIRRANRRAPGGFTQAPYDGLHRLAELLRRSREEPGFVATGVDITDPLKAAGKFPGGDHFTAEQVAELVRPQTQRQAEINPHRFVGHVLTEWSDNVPEEVAEKYPALAALILLGTDEPRLKSEDQTKTSLGIVGDRGTEVYEDRPDFHFFVGDTAEEREELAFGLNAMAAVMRGTRRRYDDIARSALLALHGYTLLENSEQEQRAQMAGILTIPAVHEKIIARYPDENEGDIDTGQRTEHLTNLLFQALPHATTNQVESREFRRALMDTNLSYDHLVYVLTPTESDDGSLISERYAEVRSEINESNAMVRLAVNRKTRIPDPLKASMRALSRGDVLDDAGIGEMTTAITSSEATVRSAIKLRARLAALADGQSHGPTISALLGDFDTTIPRFSDVRTTRGLDRLGTRLAGLVSRSELLYSTEDPAESLARTVYAAAEGEPTGAAVVTPVPAERADANGDRAAAASGPEVIVHVERASAAEMEADPVGTIVDFAQSLDGLVLTDDVIAALRVTKIKIDGLLDSVNSNKEAANAGTEDHRFDWKRIEPDVQNVGSAAWFDKKHWPGEKGKKKETPKDLNRQQATLLFSRIARRELRLGEQEGVVMNYVRDGSGNTGLDALDNTLTNRLALMAKQLGWDSSTPELKYLVMSHYASSIRPRYEELSTRAELSEPERAELSTLESISPRIDDRLDTYAEEHFRKDLGNSTIRYLDMLRYTLYTSPDSAAYGHAIPLIARKEKDSMVQKDIISKLQGVSGITTVEDLFDKAILTQAA